MLVRSAISGSPRSFYGTLNDRNTLSNNDLSLPGTEGEDLRLTLDKVRFPTSPDGSIPHTLLISDYPIYSYRPERATRFRIIAVTDV